MEDAKQKESVVETSRIENVGEDFFLQKLVLVENSTTQSMNMGVTLLCHGFLVTGILVSGISYFKNFGKEFYGSRPPEEKDIFEEMGEDIYNRPEEASTLPVYIHLKETKFFHPGGNPIPENRAVWWRGRISEVSGFFLGFLGAVKP